MVRALKSVWILILLFAPSIKAQEPKAWTRLTEPDKRVEHWIKNVDKNPTVLQFFSDATIGEGFLEVIQPMPEVRSVGFRQFDCEEYTLLGRLSGSLVIERRKYTSSLSYSNEGAKYFLERFSTLESAKVRVKDVVNAAWMACVSGGAPDKSDRDRGERTLLYAQIDGDTASVRTPLLRLSGTFLLRVGAGNTLSRVSFREDQ